MLQSENHLLASSRKKRSKYWGTLKSSNQWMCKYHQILHFKINKNFHSWSCKEKSIFHQIFDKLRGEQPDAFRKIIPIESDYTVDDLKINEAMQLKLQEEVQVCLFFKFFLVLHFSFIFRLFSMQLLLSSLMKSWMMRSPSICSAPSEWSHWF